MAFLAVLFLIGWGIAMLFFRDLAWDLTHWVYRARGIAAERTEAWDSLMALRGVLALGFGVVFLFVLMGGEAEANRRSSRQAVATANVLAELDDLESRLSPFLIEWRDLATEQIAYVSPGRFESLRGRHIFYGRCPSTRKLYVLVYSLEHTFSRDVYAYLDEEKELGNAQQCLNNVLRSGLVAYMRQGWYKINFTSSHETLFTPTPTRTPTPTPTSTPTPTRTPSFRAGL